ncbi:DUF2336 domain-containing protein [uncultured Sphingomonas sp.]|uniref:DUF2336 domain-containing protein n=1 Tax=uncultured Sphingomonas sp. TaxID=158754 RepID=UPI0035CBDD9D
MTLYFDSGDDESATTAHVRVAAADAQVDARLRHAVGDLFLADAARLDERTRAYVEDLLARIVANAEGDVRRRSASLLVARGATGIAEALLGGDPVLPRLRDAGLLRDPELVGELVARVELDALFAALAPPADMPDSPGLLPLMAGSTDDEVAKAALTLLAADNRRRAADEGAGSVGSELPAKLHRRLLWLIAAVIREQGLDTARPGFGPTADRDRAVAEATLHVLAEYDEDDRPEAAAVRLASAVGAQTDELGQLLARTLSDSRATLFTALIARAGGLDHDQARRIVTDPRGELLVLILHAVGIDRARIARIGVALAEADPRRDLDRLADAFDWTAAHDRADAREAMAPLALGRDFRDAVRSLASSG